MYGSCKKGYFRRMRRFLIPILICLLSAPAAPARADSDHDRARRALERGEILPLTDILERAKEQYPGQLIEAELEDEDDKMIYELVIISEGGRVYKLYFDARNGALLKVKGRNKHE